MPRTGENWEKKITIIVYMEESWRTKPVTSRWEQEAAQSQSSFSISQTKWTRVFQGTPQPHSGPIPDLLQYRHAVNMGLLG